MRSRIPRVMDSDSRGPHPLQKMQMMGERPTMENIGKTVTDNFKEEKGEKTGVSDDSGSPQNTISTIFSILLKALIMIGIIIGVPILIAMVIGLIGCVFFITMAGSSSLAGLDFLSDEERQYAFYGCIIGIGAILALGVPIFILLHRAFTKGRKPFSTTTRWILGILCAGGFITAAISTGILVGKAFKDEISPRNFENRRFNDRFMDIKTDDDEPVEGYDYEANGWEVVIEETDTDEGENSAINNKKANTVKEGNASSEMAKKIKSRRKINLIRPRNQRVPPKQKMPVSAKKRISLSLQIP